MNKYAGYVQPVPGGHRVMIRVCRDARPGPVLAKGGAPQVEATELDAYKLLVAHLLNFMNGAEIRGEVFEGGDYTRSKAAKSQANRIFKRSEGAAA